MQTDLYVVASSAPAASIAALEAEIARLDMRMAMLREWPQPAPYRAAELAFDGELLVAWAAASRHAPKLDRMLAEGRWRELVHANYDMLAEGVTFAQAGAGAELGLPQARYACLQPHGGSRPLHATIARWLAARCGGQVLDPFAPAAPGWRRLLAGSLANPDRARPAA